MNGSVYASSLSVEKRASAKYLRVSGKVPEPGLSKMPRGDKKGKKNVLVEMYSVRLMDHGV